MPHVFSSLSVAAAIIAYVPVFFTLPVKNFAPLSESGAMLISSARLKKPVGAPPVKPSAEAAAFNRRFSLFRACLISQRVRIGEWIFCPARQKAAAILTDCKGF
jgi:hypothetical protein